MSKDQSTKKSLANNETKSSIPVNSIEFANRYKSGLAKIKSNSFSDALEDLNFVINSYNDLQDNCKTNTIKEIAANACNELGKANIELAKDSENSKSHFMAAKAYLTQALEIKPGVKEYQNNLSISLIELENKLEFLEFSKKVEPDFERHLQEIDLEVIYAKSLFKFKKYDSAIRESKIILKKAPKDLKMKFLLGKCYYHNGEYLKAENIFREIQGAPIDNGMVFIYLAANHCKKGGYYKFAIPILEKVLNSNFENSTPGFEFGVAKCVLHNFEEAITLLSMALIYQPKNIDAKFFLGIALSITGDHKRAIKLLKDLEEQNPDHKFVPHYLGCSLLKTNKLAESLPYLIKARDNEPENGHMYSNLAAAYMELDQYSEALENIKNALILLPKRYEVRANLSEVFGKLGREEGSIKQLKIALHLKPDIASLNYNLAEKLTKLGVNARDLGDEEDAVSYFDEAKSYFQRAIALEEQNLTSDSKANEYGALGIAYKKLGKKTLAEKYLRISVDKFKAEIKEFPNKATFYADIAEAFFYLGDLGEALSYLIKLADLNKNAFSYFTKFKEESGLDYSEIFNNKVYISDTENIIYASSTENTLELIEFMGQNYEID